MQVTLSDAKQMQLVHACLDMWIEGEAEAAKKQAKKDQGRVQARDPCAGSENSGAACDDNATRRGSDGSDDGGDYSSGDEVNEATADESAAARAKVPTPCFSLIESPL